MSILSDLFDAQLAVLKSDAVSEILPVLQKASNLIASNPTIINVIAQADSVRSQLQAVAPGILQDELKALSTWISAELQKLANPPPATPPAA